MDDIQFQRYKKSIGIAFFVSLEKYLMEYAHGELAIDVMKEKVINYCMQKNIPVYTDKSIQSRLSKSKKIILSGREKGMYP